MFFRTICATYLPPWDAGAASPRPSHLGGEHDSQCCKSRAALWTWRPHHHVVVRQGAGAAHQLSQQGFPAGHRLELQLDEMRGAMQ